MGTLCHLVGDRDILIELAHRVAHALKPVSYTHLDVYKRQVMTGAHAVLKKMLVRSRYTKGIQSLVGVVTTQENASPIQMCIRDRWKSA